MCRRVRQLPGRGVREADGGADVLHAALDDRQGGGLVRHQSPALPQTGGDDQISSW